MFTLFSNLFNLKRLICNDNYLILLPDSIDNLINLKKIYCFSNQIKELPETINNLRNIDIFDKDKLTLSPQQEKYFNWIKSDKSYEFNDNDDMMLVKCAYFGV